MKLVGGTIHCNHIDKCFLQCIKANPSWSKGYARKGAALHGARKFDEAIAAYEDGLKLEDSPALRKGLQEVKDAKGDNLQYKTSGASVTHQKHIQNRTMNPPA